VEYGLEVFAGPMRAPPERRTINVPAFGSTPLQLVQLEDMEYPIFISLKYGDRVIATLQVSFRSGELPVFWRGFWDGFASKGLGIVATCGIMIVVGFVLPPKWAAAASLIVLVTGIAMNIAEVWTDVHNALVTMDSLNGLADVCEGRAKEFNEIGMTQHANELSELAQTFRLEARDIDDNLLSNVFSNLALDVSWDEIRLAFGLREQPSTRDKDYRVGYATGRIVGAIASCAAYVTTFYAVVNRIRAERIGGKPLSVKDALRIVGRGIYNWITPAIWDAVMLKLKPSFHKATDLLLGNKYSRKLGDIIGDLVERINNPLVVENTLETVSRLSKHVLENVPSRESSGRILDAISMIIEHYSPEELEEKGGAIARSIVSIWIKDGDGAVESLNGWLSINLEDVAKIDALEKVLLEIGEDAVKGVGLKIGNIIDSYLNIRGRCGEEVAKAFLSKVLKYPNQLEEILAKLYAFDFGKEPHRVTLKKGKPHSLGLGEKIKPGTYVVRICWEHDGKSGVMEFPIVKDVESDTISIHGDQVDNVLDQMGKSEAQVLITKVELFDYMLFFPTKFFVENKEIGIDLIDNEIKINERHYKFKPKTRVWEGRIRVDVELEGKNIEGKNLVLSFYEGGEVRIGYVGGHFPVRKIDVEATINLMRIKYLGSNGEEKVGEYAFNLKSLGEQMGKTLCEVVVEGQTSIKLKERLFRLLGYDALEELKERVGNDVTEDRRVILLVYFDNNRVAYCGNKRLEVRVPSEARSITFVEIVAYKEFDALGQSAIKFLEDPDNVDYEGKLGEEYVKAYLKDGIKEKASKVFEVPTEELEVKMKETQEGPDFYVYHKGKLMAIGDVKSTIYSNEFPDYLWKRAVTDSFNGKYFTRERWKDEFKNVQYGIPVAVLIKPDALTEALAKRDFKDAFEAAIPHTIEDFCKNPNYQPP
jgi:hypothetical protein